jgi:hypothetical protein
MTYSQMRDYFLILQDKFGSPYYTDDEIALFLNRAQIDNVMSLLPIDGTELNVELNENSMSRLAPLFFGSSTTMLAVSGVVLKSTIQGTIPTPMIRLLAVSYNSIPAKYTRYNNWLTYLNNVLKAPTATAPRFYEEALNWAFRPVDSTAALTFYGIRQPVELLGDGTVDCELPDFTHNDVVSRALELAGVGSRDQILSELKQLNKV